MALASSQACQQSLDGIGGTLNTPTNLLGFVSLHTATTSTTGAAEATGGGYARQACTWGAASGPTKTNTSSLAYTTTGVTPNTHFGTWSLVTAGVFGIGGALSSSVTAASITVAPGALSLGSA